MCDMLQLVVAREEDFCESQRQAEAYRTNQLNERYRWVSGEFREERLFQALQLLSINLPAIILREGSGKLYPARVFV